VLLGLTYATSLHLLFRFVFARRGAEAAGDAAPMKLAAPSSST